MSSPTALPKHVAPRELLERVDRALLARYLGPHEGFLAAHQVTLAALAATEQSDRRLVHRVYDALHAGSAPLALLTDTFAVAGVANPSTCDEVMRLDTEGKLPRGSLTPENIAFTLFLDHPELFAQVRPFASAPTAARGYSECDPRDTRPFPTARAAIDRLEVVLADELRARNRKDYCKILLADSKTEVVVDVVYGRPPAARDCVVDSGPAVRLEQETRVHTESARMLVDKATGRIALSGYPFMKEMLRRYFGEVLFGDVEFYRGRSSLTLAPLRDDLDLALSHEGVPGLAGVKLRSITIARAGGAGPTFRADRSGDVRDSPDADLLRLALSREGTVSEATLALDIPRRKYPLSVRARARDAFLSYDRSDPEVDAIARDYLVVRAMLDMFLRAAAETG